MAKKHEQIIKNPELIKRKHKQIAVGASEVIINKGFNRTSVREIAKYTGLTIGNLYDYIDTKDDVLSLIFNEFYNRWSSVLLEDSKILAIVDPKEQLKAAIESMWDVVEKIEKFVILAYRETKSLKKEDLRDVLMQESKLVVYFEQVIRRGIELGSFRKIDAVLIANTIVFLLALFPLRGWNFKRTHDYEQVKEFIIDMIFNGILENKAQDG